MCRQQQEKPADFYSNIHSNFFLNQVCTIWLKKNHIAIIPMVLRLQYDPWFPSHRKKKIICWGQCQLNMFMLQDDNRQNCPINKLPVPLRLFVKSQCKTENWNKTNILQCPTCFFDVERTNQTTGVKQSLLKWSGDPRVEKTQVRNCRRTWTSALWLYLRPQGTWVHSFIIHRLYNWVSKGYSQQK